MSDTPDDRISDKPLTPDLPPRDRVRDAEPKKGMSVAVILLLVFGLTGCVGVAVVGILAALLIPAIQKVREAEARTRSLNNMRQISIACHSYHDAFKRFPAATSVAPPNTGISWRFAVTPFVEQAALFNLGDQNSAWDSPRNSPLLNQRPVIYECPLRPDVDAKETLFQYFTGPNTMCPELSRPVKIAQVNDGLSNTFMFAEAQSPVPWTKPVDMVMTPNGPIPLPTDRFLAAMGDGSVRMFDRRRFNDGVLRMLIDPSDGNALPMNVFD